jgi:hypothetical protein
MKNAIVLTIILRAAVAMSQCVTTCGTERWNIKTGCDAGAGAINLDPGHALDTTVVQMRGLTQPANIHHLHGRAAGVEDQLFVLEATLTLFKLETDKDYHLVLRDQGKTMIAEIPRPNCLAPSSPFYAAISQLRPCFASHFGNVKGKKNLHERARVTGIGFFDFIHGQTGVSPNGIEIHPVLGITFLSDGTKCGEAAR